MTAALLDMISHILSRSIACYVPIIVVLGSSGELDLDSVDAVYAVNEEDKDENKRYLHPVL